MKIKLYNDIVFKWIFGRQKNTAPLLSLLNAAINSPNRFSEVRILNPYDCSEPFKNEKQGVLDIRGRDSDTKEWFDLEVQVVVSDIYPQRSKYYLAGMYRDQLEKSSDANYDQLKPCYGIHILVDTLFDAKEDAEFWYNHFAMLNTRSHKPLADHWHLYYIELKKFLKCFTRRLNSKPDSELEEWVYYLATTQDNTEPVDTKISHNNAIREVHDMLQTFTKDEHLREQYRLQEEFLRAQRTERALLKKEREVKEAILKEKEMALKEMALKEIAFKEMALKEILLRKEKEKERKEKEREKKEKEREKKEKERLKQQSIQFMKQQGCTPEQISEILGIPLGEVMSSED